MIHYYFTAQEVNALMNAIDKMDDHVAEIYRNMVVMKEHLTQLTMGSYTPIDQTMMTDFIEDLDSYNKSSRCQDATIAAYIGDMLAKWAIALSGGISIPDDVAGADIIAFDVVDL